MCKLNPTIRAAALTLLSLLALQACSGASESQSYDVSLIVMNSEGEPIKDAQAHMRNQLIGTTNAAGVLRTKVSGREGERATIQLKCPVGYKDSKETLSLVLRSFEEVDPTQKKGLTLKAQCAYLQHYAAVVVRTHGRADLPIYLHGSEVGRTNSQGAAHILVPTAPGEHLQLMMDTTSFPSLRPQNPIKDILGAENDDIVVFDPMFSVYKPKKKAAHRRIAKIRLPTRIQ